MKFMKQALLALAYFALCGPSLFAQDQSQQAQVININISRSIQAVNYRANGSTRIDFRGTALLPQAKGEAKVESKTSAVTIEASFDNLTSAAQLGSAYLTYVLWAISPEGRTNNLGQLILEGTKSKLQVTTRLQTFGLIVTAEPFFAVSSPSEEVVLENIARSDTKGQVDIVDAKYELLQRGRYASANLSPLETSSGVPLELLQARNAMRIARWREADKYAPESWAKAQAALNRAEDYQTRKQRKSVPTASREAVQGFEDAITISVKRQADERLAQEREASAQREAQANAAQQSEAQQRVEAEKQKLQADLAAAKDAQARAEAEKEKAEAQAQQQQAQQQATQAQQQANQAQQQAEQARQAAAKAQQEQQQLRASLLEQFNRILETRDTVRGLVVNMGDVLFASGKFDLRPEARERLAKLSGIVIAHKGLNLAVEGHTDNVNTEGFNQKLSEERAGTVRAYLIAQGLDPNSITTTGYGMSQPVADNSTAAGRQKNRRVEIVISGEIIGVRIGIKPGATQ
jgi:outer membrane protein OmpA-like peptidoglycan-associated protein